MGLCYNKRAQFNGKSSYPYKDVTPLALLLWGYYLPEVHTIIRIVHTFRDMNPEMKRYGEMLESAGAIVEWVPAGGMDCVLKSQLIRLVAFDHPAVEDYDLVVTVDVNLFVMTSHILDPLKDSPDMLAWVFQYEESAHSRQGTGETFNQNLITMRASTWREVLGYKGDLKDTVERFRTKLGGEKLLGSSTWYTDQLMTTHGLLASGICTVPRYSGLWNMKGLLYDPQLKDEKTCFHGQGYADCNKDIHIVYQGCKWWHFYPDQKIQDHYDKFYELTNHTINLDIQVLTK